MCSTDMYTGQRRTTGLTSLAQKYGHPIGTLDYTSHRILTSTGKSGLTPISSPLPTPITEERLKNYQKRRFYGFSAAELEEMGTMAALGDEQMVAELTNPIHPMYVRSQWESLADMPRHRGPVPIRGDEDGYWLVSYILPICSRADEWLIGSQKTQESGKSLNQV